jgi:hypothetical protein
LPSAWGMRRRKQALQSALRQGEELRPSVLRHLPLPFPLQGG